MFKLVIIGLATLNTSPGVSHPTELTIGSFTTVEECQSATVSLTQAIHDNFGGAVKVKDARCRTN